MRITLVQFVFVTACFGQTSQLITIPLNDCSGIPCVDLSTGDGKTLHLLLDLAERNPWISTEAAQRLGLHTEPLKTADGTAISDVQQAIVPGAKLSGLPLGDFPFMVIDTAPDPNQAQDARQLGKPLPGDGGLTYGAFQNRLVKIDALQHLLKISEPESGPAECPRNCADLTVKHFGQFGPVTLTVHGFSVNDEPVDAQIDSMFSGTVLIYPASIEKLGLKKAAKSKQKQVFPYTQNGIELIAGEAASEGFQDVTLSHGAPVYFPTKQEAFSNMQFDATAGWGLLKLGRVTFDFKGNKMWMESDNVAGPAKQ